MALVRQMFYKNKETGIINLFEGTDGYEDGGQTRDFIYVKRRVNVNFISGNILKFLVHSTVVQVTLIASNQFMQAVIDYNGKGRKIEYIPFPEVLIGKYQSFTEAGYNKIVGGYDKGFHKIADAVKRIL